MKSHETPPTQLDLIPRTLVLRTIAMPRDTNPSGDIFGGWLVSQMDLAASSMAAQRAQGRVVTAAIHDLVFLKPVAVGDDVSCYAEITKTGRTSMTIVVEVWAGKRPTDTRHKVAEGTFVFVAVDEKGKPTLLPPHGG